MSINNKLNIVDIYENNIKSKGRPSLKKKPQAKLSMVFLIKMSFLKKIVSHDYVAA